MYLRVHNNLILLDYIYSNFNFPNVFHVGLTIVETLTLSTITISLSSLYFCALNQSLKSRLVSSVYIYILRVCRVCLSKNFCQRN